jgi:cytochrome P450
MVGVMLYIREAGVPWVILNSLDIAIDLLQTQGDTYSDRSPSHFLGSLIGWKSMTVFLNDGPQLKEHRSLMLRTLGSKASLKQFEPTVTLHTRNFLSQLLKDSQPDHVSVHPHIRK